MSLVEQELPTLPEHLSSPPIFSEVRVARSLILCVVFSRSLFVLLSFFFWPLCCLSFSDYPFGFFKIWLRTSVYGRVGSSCSTSDIRRGTLVTRLIQSIRRRLCDKWFISHSFVPIQSHDLVFHPFFVVKCRWVKVTVVSHHSLTLYWSTLVLIFRNVDIFLGGGGYCKYISTSNIYTSK
jgi:hypothetical protein